MKELIEYIVKSLVDHPDEVHVAEVAGKAGIVVELRVAPEDMGRIIGKNGRVINSIRALLQVRADKLGQQASLEVIEDK